MGAVSLGCMLDWYLCLQSGTCFNLLEDTRTLVAGEVEGDVEIGSNMQYLLLVLL